MRAVVFDRYGTEEVLRTADVPRPEPGPGQVLVKVAAAAVNPADWRLRSGQFRWLLRVRLPFVLGSDVAGTVTAVGPGVDPIWTGRDVIAALPARRAGGYAEYVVVRAEHLAYAPTGMSLGEAAALPLCGLTALQALRAARLGERDRLLVHGASGGVGTMAVQIGVLLGATVTAVTSTANLEHVAGLGAHHVLDYTADDATDTLRAASGGYDVVLDAVDALSAREALRLLRPGGTAVSVNPGKAFRAPGWLAWTRGGRRLRSVLVRPDGADLTRLSHWAADGRLHPVIERAYPLEQVRDAHVRSATGRVRGKLVLQIDPEAAARVPEPTP